MVLEEHRNLRRSRRLAYQRARLQQGLLMSVILLGTILCLTLGSLLTGGAAALLMTHLSVPCRQVDTLIFEGLRCFAEGAGAGV